MTKLPSTFKGGFAPGVACVGLLVASLGEGDFFNAALASSSAFGPAGIKAGVPGSVGSRDFGWARVLAAGGAAAAPGAAVWSAGGWTGASAPYAVATRIAPVTPANNRAIPIDV